MKEFEKKSMQQFLIFFTLKQTKKKKNEHCESNKTKILIINTYETQKIEYETKNT